MRPATAAITAALLLAAPPPATAQAAEGPLPTPQHRAANASFLIAAPVPAAGPGALCLIDSGVEANPDTASALLLRTSWDGLGAAGDVLPAQHGTRMAAIAAAPVNGWGAVGAWPQLRIVSVRALPEGESGFPFVGYKRGVKRCEDLAQFERLPITAVNLSLGGQRVPPAEEAERLRDSIARARTLRRFNVVAAAGNANGPVDSPARVPGVFGVGAGDAQGALCAFSARGDGLDLIAPGCSLQTALPDGTPALSTGTSGATAFTSAVLVALRSYRPELGPDEAEALLTGTARGGALDAEAAFRAAGLERIVDEGNAALRALTASSAPPAPPPAPAALGAVTAAPPAVARLPTPRARVTLRGGRLTVRTSNRPRGAAVRVVAHGRRRGQTLSTTITRWRSAISIDWSPTTTLVRVLVSYRPPDGSRSPSRRLTWRPPAR